MVVNKISFAKVIVAFAMVLARSSEFQAFLFLDLMPDSLFLLYRTSKRFTGSGIISD